jgi:hypothetical protein
MTAKIDTTSFDLAIKRLNTSSRELQNDLVKNLHDFGPKVESEIKGGAFTRVQAHAASTVQVSGVADGLSIQGGGGGGLGGTLFAGGEFGGRKSKKVYYPTRSRSGGVYVVKRRTTMQFLPHLGNEGYFFWPAIRDWLPRLLKVQTETLERSVSGR